MSCLTYYGLSNLIFYERKMNSFKSIEIYDVNLPSISNFMLLSKITMLNRTNKSIDEEKSNKCIIMVS